MLFAKKWNTIPSLDLRTVFVGSLCCRSKTAPPRSIPCGYVVAAKQCATGINRDSTASTCNSFVCLCWSQKRGESVGKTQNVLLNCPLTTEALPCNHAICFDQLWQWQAWECLVCFCRMRSSELNLSRPLRKCYHFFLSQNYPKSFVFRKSLGYHGARSEMEQGRYADVIFNLILVACIPFIAPA